jgi:hypothetical protein
VADVTDTRPGDDTTQIWPIALRRRTVERRREALDNLWRLAVQLDTASALECRAERSASPALAAVLRERAVERRRIAAVIRAHLAEEGLSAATRAHLPLVPRPSGS